MPCLGTLILSGLDSTFGCKYFELAIFKSKYGNICASLSGTYILSDFEDRNAFSGQRSHSPPSTVILTFIPSYTASVKLRSKFCHLQYAR